MPQRQSVAPTARQTRSAPEAGRDGSFETARATPARAKPAKGQICGNADILGEAIGNVPGKLNGCGIPEAVRVRSISGVTLSQQSVMNCTTAQALNTWVSDTVTPAFRKRGKVTQLRVAAHYACRTRNNIPGGKISEHGKGKAIDISGFTLQGGEIVSVKQNWSKGRLMRDTFKGACGPFSTTLGPGSDRYHSDHFHLDTYSRRKPYCG